MKAGNTLSFIRNLHKGLALGLAVGMVLFSSYYPVFATETDSTDTEEHVPAPEIAMSQEPEPTPAQTHIENEATLINDITSAAESGTDTVTEPTPTPTESSVDEEASPSADVSGSTEATTSSTTGDTIAITEVETLVNTTSVNSTFAKDTINVGSQTNGNIEVSDTDTPPPENIPANAEEPEESTGSATILNDAEVTNSIQSLAESGSIAIENASSAAMTTGNAISIVDVSNLINTTIIDSLIHIFTINIFGDVNGNIVLPENLASSDGGCCEQAIGIQNQATVENILYSLARSGDNTLITNGDGTGAILQTGDAQSAVNVINLINQNFIDAQIMYLFVNVFGSWAGDFRGWLYLNTQDGGTISLHCVPESNNIPCDTCVDNAEVENTAQVTNIIGSTAISGSNTLKGGSGDLQTGNAYSVINLLNFINTNIIRSTGYFGFINIFGSLHGDIGGASTFTTAPEESTPSEPTQTEETTTSSTTEEASKPRESGGQLTVTNDNNVGAWVLPGDTVTFFIKIKNTGTGMVYDTGLDLFLMNEDGYSVGGQHYEIGNIALNSGAKLTTGFVLSDQTPPGTYVARAIVSGSTGPNNDMVAAAADSSFLVFGSLAAGRTLPVIEAPIIPEPPQVLGVTAPKDNPNILMALLVLLLLIPVYKSFVLIQNPAQIKIIFAPEQSWAYRFRAIMTLLL